MINNIPGKYVLITGCDSGFGRRLTEKLLHLGVHVFAGCYTKIGKESLENEFGELKGKLMTVNLDITNQQSIDHCYELVVEILKKQNAKLHALINNAGFLAVYGPMDWLDVSEYEQSINVNLLGNIRMTTKFLQLIKESKGRIVNMISSFGRIHGFYTAPYVTAKFGLEGYVDSLRLEMKQFGVKVSSLEPGGFKTNIMDPDAMTKRVEFVWGRLNEEIKTEYGEKFKNQFVKNHNLGSSFIANPNLDLVVDSYIHALFAENPKIRYTCGYDAKFFYIPFSFLPSSWQDFLLEIIMQIGYSKPAILYNNSNFKVNFRKKFFKS
uniref:Uncharacterized protein n=1 Tax=Panagrolaimus sp. JU765 TaxID=591449 RepID=A0AC34R7V6_9BILA